MSCPAPRVRPRLYGEKTPALSDHIAHIVAARRFSRQEFRRLDGALSKHGPGISPVLKGNHLVSARENHIDQEIRFDILAIILNDDTLEINHIENAFTA